jgi:alpha-maltose-1-phosphate synthase
MKKKKTVKKIVLLGLNGRGGPLTYSCILASYLTKYCDVTLLLPSYSQPDKLSKKVKLLRTTAPPKAIPTFLLTFNIFQHIWVIRKINKENPDIINILDIHPWYRLYWPFLKAKKKIVTINDPEMHSGDGGFILRLMINTVTRFLLRKADRIITLSKSQVDVIRKLGYKQPVTASKLGNQHEMSKADDKILTKTDPKKILFFGRIKDYKGLKYLLEAASILKNQKVKFKLIIAGPGDITPYEDAIKKLGPEYCETDIREIYGESITKHFQSAAFTVLPYTDATQTGIASIAYSFKKPLIVTNVGSLPEVVVEGKTGLIIEPKNVKQLSNAMKSMLSNPAKTKQMGVEGNKFLKKEYDWNVIVKKLYEEAYEQ